LRAISYEKIDNFVFSYLFDTSTLMSKTISQNAPLVSICIPVYNSEKYIKEAIECCINQTYKNLEIVISDNCSTDKTIELIKSYNDSRIKIYHNETNQGLLYNFKKVCTYATGKYMSILFSDDGMELNAIEKGVNLMEAPENKNIVLVNTYLNVINDEGKHIITKKFILGGGKFTHFGIVRANLFYGSNSIGEPNGSLFRKSAYDKIPEPKFKNANVLTPDIDLKFELLFWGDTYVIPEPLGKYRLSTNSTSVSEIKFKQAQLFKEYVFNLYRDERYKLSFFWVITATVNAYILQIVRHLFYLFFIRNKD
jgi:glycosyltransferase involved in cell wall biosynthesis